MDTDENPLRRKERAVRLIDADALKEWIDEYVSVFKKSDTREIKGYVEHQPTIDAIPIEHINLMNLVEVVRCKECRKSHIDGKTTHYLWCTEWGRSTDTFGYCERGEREGE